MVLVYGSKCVCRILVNVSSRGIGLWVEMFLCLVRQWYGSNRGIGLWVEMCL